MSRSTISRTAIYLIIALSSIFGLAQGQSLEKLGSPMEILRPLARPAVAVCSLKNNNGTAMAYNSAIDPGDRYTSFINPENCQGSPYYPMSVYWVSFPIYPYTGAHWPVGIKIEFWGPKSADSCQGPKELLYSYHILADSSKFAAPHVGVVTLPDPVCLTGPFYVSIEYDGSTAAPYPSVLFDTQYPANPCLNWVYRKGWHPWNEFFNPPGAGNLMIWIDGYSNSNYCATTDSITNTIPGLYDRSGALTSSRVTVLGYYTDSADGKLVNDYAAFMANSPMGSKSALMLVGPRPDSSYQGDLVKVTGYLMSEPNPHPTSTTDSVILRLFPSRWETVINAPVYPSAGASPSNDALAREPMATCDSCRYGLYVGGGVNEANDHLRYWNELAGVYGSDKVCDNNAFALYGAGKVRDTLGVPQYRTDSLTPGNLLSTITEVSRRVGICKRKATPAVVSVYLSGQQSAGNLMTLGGVTVDFSTLRSYMQKLVDSGAGQINVTVTGSYGGDLADTLKKIDTKKTAQLHVQSAAGNNQSYGSSKATRFARMFSDSLKISGFYDFVVGDAAVGYHGYLDTLVTSWQSWLTSAKAWLVANPVGTISDSIRLKVVADSLALQVRRTAFASSYSTTVGRPRIWSTYQLGGSQTWHEFGAPSGGEIVLTFSGDTSATGNLVAYKDTSVASVSVKRKVGIFNWNIPGTTGFTAGNDKRVLLGGTARSSFWLEEESKSCSLILDRYTDQPFAPSVSNPYAFPGFSFGARDHSAGEFGVLPFSYTMSGCEQTGMRLDSVPQQWGGTRDIVFNYNVPSLTAWHSGMQLVAVVNGVIAPGTLNFVVSGMQDSIGSWNITAPETFKFACNAQVGTGAQRVEILPSSANVSLDYWTLRSTAFDPPPCCIGTTGNVNGSGIVDLGDLAMLVSYLTAGSVTPSCLDEANVNGVGIVDIGDLSYLVSYLTVGTPALPACP